MRDWIGTRVREDALVVGCRYCFAPIGSPCVVKPEGKPLEAFPAHTVRINDSRKVGDHPYASEEADA